MSKKSIHQLFMFFHELLQAWKKHKTEQLGAALAFYAIIALPSLVILIFFLASFYFQTGQVKIFMNEGLSPMVESEVMQALNGIINSILNSKSSSALTGLGILVLIWSASLFFEHLKNSLNYLWKISSSHSKKIWKLILNKLFDLFFILFIEIFLFLPIFIRSLFTFIQKYLIIDNQVMSFLFNIVNFILIFISPFLLFLFIFKFLADAKITLKDSSIGALFTTLLFIIGNLVLSFYFNNFMDFSAFGGASALILVLVWFYYIAQILFLGAEFTYLYSNKYGRKIISKDSNN